MTEPAEQLRERLERELRSQAERIQRLEQSLRDTAHQHEELERSVREQLAALSAQAVTPGPQASFAWLLAAVQKMARAASREAVYETLAEQIHQAGARSAVFAVREQVATCYAARGFRQNGEGLSQLAIPLASCESFSKVCETHLPLKADVSGLGSRELLAALEISDGATILLVPIQQGHSISAIVLSEPAQEEAMPLEALQVLAEFASAHLSRLSAEGGAAQTEGAVAREERAGDEAPTEAASVEPALVEPEAQTVVQAANPAPAEAAAPSEGLPSAPMTAAQPAVNVEQLSEAEEKVHRDAKRFSRLLVSEIELYNKTKVAEGRKNRDLYSRLKTDIERSRQTYQKRFGNTAARQFDYFHEELVRTLAQGDPSLLGPDYPGPTM